MTKDELIAALEKATGPDAALVPWILRHTLFAGAANVSFQIGRGDGGEDELRVLADGYRHYFSSYEWPDRSIDAALTLAAKDWSIEIYRSSAERGAKKCVASVGTYDCDQGHLATGKATTPAIALCIANLRAREA